MGEQAALLERSADISAFCDVVPISELPYDIEARERHASWLGGLAMEQMVHAESLGLAEKPRSLADIIQDAAQGDPKALAALDTNASTLTFETALKSGHITTVTSEVIKGDIAQHGHTYSDVFKNTLLNSPDNTSVFYARSVTEALNWKREVAAIEHGDLDDHWMFELSHAPQGLSVAELKKGGIFVETLSAAFRCSTIKDGSVHTETAFVAGVDRPQLDPLLSRTETNAALEAAITTRFDLKAVHAVLAELGVQVADNASPEDLLALPLRFHKSVLPHGVASFVALYDQKVAELTGKEVFFGQDAPKQEYATFADACAQKEQQFAPVIAAVRQDMLDSAASVAGDPNGAIQLLDKRVEYHLQEAAYRDKRIDESIFGPEAVRQVRIAREAYENNDVIRFMMARSQVQALSEITRCGGGTSRDKELLGGTQGGEASSGGETGGGTGTTGFNAPKGGETKLEWRSGYCRVSSEQCPEKGKKTLVAQCDVCYKCQAYFNRGIDPTKFSKGASLFSRVLQLTA